MKKQELSLLEMGTKLVKRGPSAKQLSVKELREIGKKLINNYGKR